MRSRRQFALSVKAMLSLLPTSPATGSVTGTNAESMSDEDACRLGGRLERQRFSGRAMPLDVLVKKSIQKRRARQTKPGKRGARN